MKIDKNTRFQLNELKNVILLILTTIDLLFIFISIVYMFDSDVETIFTNYDYLVCLLLFIDLCYDYYTYKGSLKDFLFKDKNILSIISILPFDIILRYFSVFRLFRFAKILRLVRIYNVKKDYGSFVYFIRHHLFKLLFIILCVYIAVSSVMLIIFDDAIDTLGDAFWYIIVTTSTVGYGDIIPVSPIGKALTILTILIGILFVAIFTAYLSALYNEKPERETRGTLIKHFERVEKTNKIMKIEIQDLNKKIEQMEEQNIHLNRKLSKMEDTMEDILKKLEEK